MQNKDSPRKRLKYARVFYLFTPHYAEIHQNHDVYCLWEPKPNEARSQTNIPVTNISLLRMLMNDYNTIIRRRKREIRCTKILQHDSPPATLGKLASVGRCSAAPIPVT